MVWRALRILAGIVAALVALILLYGLVALAGALLPLQGRAQSMLVDDPPLFVCASLAHTDIIVPLSDPAVDWRSAFGKIARELPDNAYLAIGWGDLGFYQNTPQWRDLTVTTAFRAFASLGPTTLHILAVNVPTGARSCVKILVDRAGRETLGKFVLATAVDDPSGAPEFIASPRPYEAFYAAHGRYSPWRTCNVWASQALSRAGMPAALWAPFSFGVMWPLGRGAE